MHQPACPVPAVVDGCSQCGAEPETSKLKEALDEALMHTKALRCLLEASGEQTSPAAAADPGCAEPLRPLTNATTRTESSPPAALLITPHRKQKPTHGQQLLIGTPGLASSATPLRGGVIETAVQQACRNLLTPQPRTTSKPCLAAQQGGGLVPQNTPEPCSAFVSAGIRQRLESPRTVTPLSQEELALAPFGAYQQAKEAQDARQEVPEPAAAESGDGIAAAAATAPSLGNTADLGNSFAVEASCDRRLDDLSGKRLSLCDGPSLTLGPAGAQSSLAVAAAAPPLVAGTSASSATVAAEPGEPCFTPNTTAIRLRAAMQWMQLQLQVSPCRLARPRRYSDSSVSPALKILAPCNGGEVGAAAQPVDTAAATGGGGGAEAGLQQVVTSGLAPGVELAEAQRTGGLSFDGCDVLPEHTRSEPGQTAAQGAGSAAAPESEAAPTSGTTVTVAAANPRAAAPPLFQAAELKELGRGAPAFGGGKAAGVDESLSKDVKDCASVAVQCPLRDISLSATNAVQPRRQEPQGMKQQQQREHSLGRSAKAEEAEPPPKAGAQRPGASGRLRFGLRW